VAPKGNRHIQKKNRSKHPCVIRVEYHTLVFSSELPAMNPIPQSWHNLMDVFAGGDAAWRAPEQIAEALGDPIDETNDLLADLHVAGLLDVWERDEGIVVALSPLGASVARLRIVEQGPRETPTWGRIGDPPPPVPRARGVAASGKGADFDLLADPRPARPRGERGRHDTPSLLIGLGTTPWPSASEATAAVCPICGSKRLPSHAYCLYCDRWGGDPAEPDRSHPDSHARSAPPARSRDLSASERASRAARKAKRQQRMAQRIREARKSDPARKKGGG